MLGADECDVLFHDAARPLLDQRIIADCVARSRRDRAIGVAVPSSDTIVEVADGVVTGMPRATRWPAARRPRASGSRSSAGPMNWPTQTRASRDRPATDDCGVVLRYLPDVPVRLVPGSERNIKITYPGDLEVAEALLRRRAGRAGGSLMRDCPASGCAGW